MLSINMSREAVKSLDGRVSIRNSDSDTKSKYSKSKIKIVYACKIVRIFEVVHYLISKQSPLLIFYMFLILKSQQLN